MEINLLEHSTYDVDKIKQNKEFLQSLIKTIGKTYENRIVSDYGKQNERNVSIAPSINRIANVFICLRVNGEIEFSFKGDTQKLKSIKNNSESYKLDINYHGAGTTLDIQGVTIENHQQHLPNIVKAIEACDYSFK